MLEQYFTLPAVLHRHRSGLLGPYLDSFVSMTGGLGYPKATVRAQCCVVRDLGLWLEQEGLAVSSLDDDVVRRHIADRRQSGKCGRGIEAAVVRRLVDHLRKLGVLVSRESAPDESPVMSTLQGYTEHLLVERAVAQVTVDNYVPFVHQFLEQRFGDGPLSLREMRESDVSDFVLRWIRSNRPGRAKLLATALRSFFRFLLERGEIDVDLSGAVPMVADRRVTTTPKYLSREQVELLLASCDRATAIGRRDLAVLLLLARLGLRAGEVVALGLDDVDWRAGEVLIHGKGAFHDRLPLPHEVGKALADHLRRDRPKCSTRRFFVRRRAPHSGFASSAAVDSIVRRALRRIAVDPPMKGAHLLRHSLATCMLRSGASLAEIAQVLRHRSAATTEIYAKVDVAGLRDCAQPWPIRWSGQ